MEREVAFHLDARVQNGEPLAAQLILPGNEVMLSRFERSRAVRLIEPDKPYAAALVAGYRLGNMQAAPYIAAFRLLDDALDGNGTRLELSNWRDGRIIFVAPRIIINQVTGRLDADEPKFGSLRLADPLQFPDWSIKLHTLKYTETD